MKKLVIFLFLLFIFCSKEKKNILEGRWDVHHIIINGKDIFGNQLNKRDMFDQTVSSTRQLTIRKDSLYLILDRNKGAIKAKINFKNDNSIIINSQAEKYLNSSYTISIDTLPKYLQGVKGFDIQVVLKSKDKALYMNRLEIANKEDLWINKQ